MRRDRLVSDLDYVGSGFLANWDVPVGGNAFDDRRRDAQFKHSDLRDLIRNQETKKRLMIRTPIFFRWRPVWETVAPGIGTTADDLATARNKKRCPTPSHHWTRDDLSFIRRLSSGSGLGLNRAIVRNRALALIKKCLWSRWNLLECALNHAAGAGDLQCAALILRGQIEELDVLQAADAVLASDAPSRLRTADIHALMKFLGNRLLPRDRSFTSDELQTSSTTSTSPLPRPESLARTYDTLSEYVHPNYNSYLLTLTPHSAGAAKVLLESFADVYKHLLSLPCFSSHTCDANAEDQIVNHLNESPLQSLAEDILPSLRGLPSGLPDDAIDSARNLLLDYAERQSSALNGATGGDSVGAVDALRKSGECNSEWPSTFGNAFDIDDYTRLFRSEQELSRDATLLSNEGTPVDQRQRLSVVLSALTFAITVAEYRIRHLARHAGQLLLDGNVPGASVLIRSIMEHHAIAFDISGRAGSMWDKVSKVSDSETKTQKALQDGERQIARVLAGGRLEVEFVSSWKTLWGQVTSNNYNIMGPIQNLNGMDGRSLLEYGWLSHIAHGSMCTSGELVSIRESDWSPIRMALVARLVAKFADLISFDSFMLRQARAMAVAYQIDMALCRVDDPRRSIMSMRVSDDRKLKRGRDVFGSGTADGPYKFRDSLLYHTAFYAFLKQEQIIVSEQSAVIDDGQLFDRVVCENGDVLFFLPPKQL